MNAQVQDGEGELISAESSINQALAQITKGEIDQQIATAHQYPRSIAKFQKRALEMVTLDEETASSCLYSRPVGKGPDGKQKFADGMSIRMAEVVGSCYGNLRVGAMLVEMTPRYVKARGFAHDLETNFASTSEVVESTVDRNNRPFSERMRVVVAKAALSKARRDATFSVVPRALCKRLEADARKTAVGDATTLAKRRDTVMKWVASLGIEAARVFAALNVGGEADIGLDELTTLTGIKTAIKDGDTTIDEAFPPVEDATQPRSRADAAKDALKGAGAQKPAADPKQQQTPPKEPAKEPASDLGGAVPQFDDKTAIAELEKAKTVADLDAARKSVWKDFSDTKRQLPIAVEARYNELKETLGEAEAKKSEY